MAPTLSSNSFRLHTAPLTQTSPRFTVLAKRSFFPIYASSSEKNDDKANNSKPFFKAPDMKSLIPVIANPSSGLSFVGQKRKDPSTIFVAGGTGQTGVRVAQMLLKEGFTVRAGVPDLGEAQELAQIASSYKIISKEELKRLNAVESTFQDPESIAKAIGNASKLVVTVGSSENGPSGPVTLSDAVQVIQAAQLAGVRHVAIIYDMSRWTVSTGNVLDGITSFFNNIFARSQPLVFPEFIEKIVATDLRYTLIKANLTEDYSPEGSYNVVVSAEGSVGAYDYKVGKSQIASLVASVFSNTEVAENKIVQVYTDPKAPSRPIIELFSAIPEDGRRKAYTEAIAKVKAEEEAQIATEKAKAAAEVAKNFEAKQAQLASLAEDAKAKAAEAGASFEGILGKAKDIGSELSWDKLSSQFSTAVEKATEKPIVQVATVRGQAKARSLNAKKAVIKQTSPNKGKKRPEAEIKTEKRNLFGGLFQQETFYVDDA